MAWSGAVGEWRDVRVGRGLLHGVTVAVWLNWSVTETRTHIARALSVSSGDVELLERTATPDAGLGRRARWWHELVLVAVLYAGYDAVRGLIAGSTARAEHDGWDILHLETRLHLDPERWLNATVSHTAVLAVPASYFYATLHFIITPAVLIWIYRQRPAGYRYARNVLATITAAALAGFWLFPTAPPRLLTGAGFHDTLAAFSTWGWWGADPAVPAGAAAIANQYAAMPSLHLAWAAWCGATIYRHARHRQIRILAVSYPLATVAVILGTANHYLLDVLAGVALWVLAEAAVPRLRLPGMSARMRISLGDRA